MKMGTFQSLILDAYGRQCAVTRERCSRRPAPPTSATTASAPSTTSEGGLFLRSDVHRLFDAGYVTVTPQYEVEVSHRIRDDFNDGENYLRLHGDAIVVPEREGWQPDREALAWHNDVRFRG